MFQLKHLLKLDSSQVSGLSVKSAGTPSLIYHGLQVQLPDLNHYNIYRSPTNGFTVNTATNTPIASPTTNSYSDTGLTASTRYYYRVATVNNNGIIGPVSAQAGAETGPPQVTGLTVTAPSSTQINLSWTASTAPDLNHYQVF